jgi:hypothetical protein
MKKWLCVWKIEAIGSPRAIEPPLKKTHDPKKVISSLGFDPDRKRRFKRKEPKDGILRHPREYEVHLPYHLDQDVLVRFEGAKGDRTHLVIVDSTRHQRAAKLYGALDQRHNEYMINYDTFSSPRQAENRKLTPEEIRKRFCGVHGRWRQGITPHRRS